MLARPVARPSFTPKIKTADKIPSCHKILIASIYSPNFSLNNSSKSWFLLDLSLSLKYPTAITKIKHKIAKTATIDNPTSLADCEVIGFISTDFLTSAPSDDDLPASTDSLPAPTFENASPWVFSPLWALLWVVEELEFGKSLKKLSQNAEKKSELPAVGEEWKTAIKGPIVLAVP